MGTSSYERRFARVADTDPAGFGAAIKARYGHDIKTVTALLDCAARLASPAGAKMTADDVAMLKRAHPDVAPSFLADVAKEINAAPAHMRATYLIGAITGDAAVIGDRLVDAGSNYREVNGLLQEYITQDYVDAIAAKRGDKPEAASPAWKPEPGSVRDLLERQMTGRGIREYAQAVEDGDPRAEAMTRHALAHDIERASDKLQDDSLSLREHLTAATDLQEFESLAADQFGATPGEAT